MSAILFWFLLLLGADLGPAASAATPADMAAATTTTVTVLDDGSGIPPRQLP